MKKKLFVVTIALIMLMGLNACCTIAPGKVVYSEDLTRKIEEMGVKASIHVSEEGKLLIYNEKGEALEQCVLPKPDMDSQQTKRGGLPVCKGMTKGSAVTSIQTLPVLKSNSTQCITFGPDGSGHFYQYCWEVP